MSKSFLNLFFKILLAPLFWLFQACSPIGEPVDKSLSNNHYYSSSKSDVVYSAGGNWFSVGKTPLHADVKSFKVLSPLFGKDKDAIYYGKCKVQNDRIDINSFYVKQGEFMVDVGFDQKHVFVFNDSKSNGKCHDNAAIVENADPKSYERLDLDWGKDGSNHFYRSKKIEADYGSFKIINKYFVGDNYRIYGRIRDNFQVLPTDPSSFRLFLETHHGMDDNFIYWLSFFTFTKQDIITLPYYNKIEDVQYLNKYYLKIGKDIYYDGRIMSGVDGGKFIVVQGAYAKDDQHIYYKNEIIPDADYTTFRKEENRFSVVDKNGKYRNGKIVKSVPN